LIEIMVVVAIIGLVAAMGLPSLISSVHRSGMPKALDDIKDLCSSARRQAIFSGHTMEVVFHPLEKRMEVAAAPTDQIASPAPADTAAAAPPPAAIPTPPPSLSAVTTTATLPDTVSMEMLDINLQEYKDSEEARVRFFPNGTCDEMTVILNSGSDWRKITLEFSTSLATVSTVTR